MTLQTGDVVTVLGLAVVDPDTGSCIQYEGVFTLECEPGQFVVRAPVDTDEDGSLHEDTAERLDDRTDDLAIALWADGIAVSGVITSVSVIEGELTVVADDGNRLAPDELPDGVSSEVHGR